MNWLAGVVAVVCSGSVLAQQCPPFISVVEGKINPPTGFEVTDGYVSKHLTTFLQFNSASYNFHNKTEAQDGKISCNYSDPAIYIETTSLQGNLSAPKPARPHNKWEVIFKPNGYACVWAGDISPAECQW